MTPAEVVGLIAAAILAALFGIIAYLLKGRFDAQTDDLQKVKDTLEVHGRALATLAAAQSAVMENQRQLSAVHSKLIDNTDDLEDETSQLHDATGALFRRAALSDAFIAKLKKERGEDP